MASPPLRADPVEITDAWIRATPPGVETAAAYVTISSSRADRLGDASSDSARDVQIHEVTNDDGIMRMRRVESVNLDANATVRLEPGGMHLMMFGIDKAFVPGDEVVITLVFDNAGEIEHVFTVRDARWNRG